MYTDLDFFSHQGGIAFITIKGVLKVYYKQQQYLRQINRVVLDYPEEEAQQTQPSSHQ